MKTLKGNRYLGLIVALLILVMILSAGFFVNYRWSQRNAQILDGANYVGDLSDAMLHIAARANHLVIMDDDDTEKRQQLLAEIHTYQTQAEENLNNMMSDENMVAVPGLQDKMRLLAENWRIYNEKILSLKLNERSHELDLANYVYTRLEPNHETILELYYDYFNESYEIIRRSNYLQVGLAAFSFIYFIFLIFFYFKRFIRVDTELNEAQQEMQQMMDTIDSGLFLLEKDLSIGKLQSHRLEDFLGDEQLTGVSLVQSLKKIGKDRDAIQSFQEFIEQLYNPKVKEKLIESLNPLDQFQSTLGGKNRYLKFNFKRVYSGTEIVKVLVNITDITSNVLLAQQQKEEHDKNEIYLTMLQAMQNTERHIIDDFMQRVKNNCIEINQLLREQENNSDKLRLKIEKIWRMVHSIKGEASALKLGVFQEACERFEDELKKKQQEPNLTGEHFFGMVIYLDKLINITKVLLGFLGGKMMQPAVAQVNKEAQYYQQFVSDLAERQGKQVDCAVVGLEQLDNAKLRPVLREIAVQIVRNAVVHGIEAPAERSALGKLTAGRVRVVLSREADAWVLDVEDDGRGLDYEAIRRKAVSLGWYDEAEAQALDNKALLGLMFRSQLSTAEKQDSDAGRGVGLDIVKHTVQAHGGRLKVMSQKGRYTRFTFIFPQ